MQGLSRVISKKSLCTVLGIGGFGLGALALNNVLFTGSSQYDDIQAKFQEDSYEELRRERRVNTFRERQARSLLPQIKEPAPEDPEKKECLRIMTYGANVVAEMQSSIKFYSRDEVARFVTELMAFESDEWDQQANKDSMRECARFLEKDNTLFLDVKCSLEEEEQERIVDFLTKIQPLSDLSYRKNFVSFIEEALTFKGNYSEPNLNELALSGSIRRELFSYIRKLMKRDSITWDEEGDASLSKQCALYFAMNEKEFELLQSKLEPIELLKLTKFFETIDVEDEVQKIQEEKESKAQFLKCRINNKRVPEFWNSVDSWTGLKYAEWESDVGRLMSEAQRLMIYGKDKTGIPRSEVFRYMSDLIKYDSKGDAWKSKKCFIHFKVYQHDLIALQRQMNATDSLELDRFMRKMENRYSSNVEAQKAIRLEKKRTRKLFKNMVSLGLNTEALSLVKNKIDEPNAAYAIIDSL